MVEKRLPHHIGLHEMQPYLGRYLVIFGEHLHLANHHRLLLLHLQDLETLHSWKSQLLTCGQPYILKSRASTPVRMELCVSTHTGRSIHVH